MKNGSGKSMLGQQAGQLNLRADFCPQSALNNNCSYFEMHYTFTEKNLEIVSA
jgi:hypothetical protein